MPSALSQLVDSLMGSREGVLPSIQAFPPLDIDQIATELRLEELAEERATQNLPSSESEVEDSVEGALLAEIERRARKAEEDYRSQLDLYDGRIGRALVATDQRALIEAAGVSAVTDFKVQAIDDLNHLHDARREVEGRQREFEAFRVAHRLKRLPHDVSPVERLARGLMLAIFVVVESILNGSFFAEGSETGWIGGGLQALVLSVLNVGGALLYARYGLPLMLHRNQVLKSCGVAATLAFIAWAIVLNVLVGVFRDLFIQQIGQVSVADFSARLAAAPLILQDTRSVILVALGMGLSLASLIDAVGMRDPYPGYGAVGVRRARAVLAYATAKRHCLAGLTQLRDDAIEKMSQVIELMRNAEHELRLAVAGRSRLYQNYRAFLSHLTQCHAQLSQRYRDVNIRSRQTPAPSRFTQPVAPPEFLIAPTLPELPNLAQDARTHVIERMEHFITAVNQQFETEVHRYQTLADLDHDAAP